MLRALLGEQATGLAAAAAAPRGRPLAETLVAEVMPLAEACRFLEREAGAILRTRGVGGWRRPLWLPGVRSEVARVPWGVVLVIAPGNYPLLLAGVQALQAVAAGNAVVVKPAQGGAGAAATLRDLAVQAGIDPALWQVLGEDIASARAALDASPDKVLFTGGTATGRRIARDCADRLIPATLELGGHDAVIVREDADLDLVVACLDFGLRLNAGATCMAPKRVFVHRAVATELEGRLARPGILDRSDTAAGRLSDASHEPDPVRSPFQFGGTSAASPQVHAPHPDRSASCHSALRCTDMTHEHYRFMARDQIPQLQGTLNELVTDALAHGAHMIRGTGDGAGGWIGPVILGGVRLGSRLLREEAFGPVLALITVSDDVEAESLANDCGYALGATVFTRDEAAGRELARRLRCGFASVNDLILPSADPRLPFGGSGWSGHGVTRGVEGLLELTRPRVVTRTRGRFRPALKPLPAGVAGVVADYLGWAHARGIRRRMTWFLSLARSAWDLRRDSARGSRPSSAGNRGPRSI